MNANANANARDQAVTALVPEKQEAILERLRCCLPQLSPLLQPETKFDGLGIDSIDRIELLCIVSKEFNLRMSVSDYQSFRTIGDLADFIAHTKNGG